MELREIRVVHYGLGAIGSIIARLTSAQRGLQVVGGIDRDPAKVGRDLGEVIGLDHPLGAPISDDADLILEQTRPDVVILATTSLFHEVYPQILTCIRARASVISTCEELVYPYAKSSAATAELNRLALLSGVTVLGVVSPPDWQPGRPRSRRGVRRARAVVHASALQILGNPAAQDVVQDVFVELRCNPQRYDESLGTLRTLSDPARPAPRARRPPRRVAPRRPGGAARAPAPHSPAARPPARRSPTPRRPRSCGRRCAPCRRISAAVVEPGVLRRIELSRRGAADAQTAARQRLLDALAAGALGCHTPEGRLLERYAGRGHGNGPTCRLLTGAARSTELDDIDLPGCTTVGAVVVPVAVTMAAGAPAVGDGALLSAVVAGYEAIQRARPRHRRRHAAVSRRLADLRDRPVCRGGDAARFLGLDAAATARALGLALTRSDILPRRPCRASGFATTRSAARPSTVADAAFASAAGVEADPTRSRLCGAARSPLDAAELTRAAGSPWLVSRGRTASSGRRRGKRSRVWRRFAELELPAGRGDDRADRRRRAARLPRDVDRPRRPATHRVDARPAVPVRARAFAPQVLDDAVAPIAFEDPPAFTALMAEGRSAGRRSARRPVPAKWGVRVTLRFARWRAGARRRCSRARQRHRAPRGRI